MAERARLERDGDLGVLVIDHQPLNLFDAEMVRDILAGLDQAERLPGAPRAGGGEVLHRRRRRERSSRACRESDAVQLTADLLAITHRIEELPFPTLASVQGLCLTAGLELSLACDMIWAAESAQFGLVEAVIGLTPLMGGTQRIAERAGPARARELVMSGGLYDAATLERWNVVNRVLPDAELAEKSLRSRSGWRPARRGRTTPPSGSCARSWRRACAAPTRRTAEIGAPLFETDDLRQAVESFSRRGRGRRNSRAI